MIARVKRLWPSIKGGVSGLRSNQQPASRERRMSRPPVLARFGTNPPILPRGWAKAHGGLAGHDGDNGLGSDMDFPLQPNQNGGDQAKESG